MSAASGTSRAGLGEILFALMRAAKATLRRARAQRRQQLEAMQTYALLRELDDRTLRDLGIRRDEIWSLVPTKEATSKEKP